VDGTVIQAPAAGEELVSPHRRRRRDRRGHRPAGYMEAQGFTLQAGERVQNQRLPDRGRNPGGAGDAAGATAATIALRDQAGRPMWAGGGRARALAARVAQRIPAARRAWARPR